MAKSAAKARARRKQSDGSSAALFILFAALGVGLFIGLAGFEAGATVGNMTRAY